MHRYIRISTYQMKQRLMLHRQVHMIIWTQDGCPCGFSCWCFPKKELL